MDLVQGQPPEHYLDDIKRYSNGRRNLQRLKKHYLDNANVTRRVTDADQLA